MRIDKYLWCVRLFKTRSLAAGEADKNHVEINGQTCKPSREVKAGDEIKIRKEQVYFKYRVLDFPKSRVGAKLVENYIEDLTDPAETERMKLLQSSKTQYTNRWREGRPSKKDRRELDNYMED